MTSATDRRSDLWALFAVLWASSALFHLAGNTRLAPEWGRALLGATAIAVLARPRIAWLTVPLAGAVLTNVWLEAPLLGNHWLLQGFIAVIVLGAVIGARGEGGVAISRLVGPARLTLLAFYGFAAFAKLNSDFFEPVSSCAVFYFRESADSWGVLAAFDGLSSGGERAVAVVVASVELSVPILLFFRRTRTAGVLLGLGFHFVLALDRTHQFFDFSSILLVLFVLFLGEDTRHEIVDAAARLRRTAAARWASGPEIAHLLVLAALAGAVAFASGPADWSAPRDLRLAGVWAWIVVGSVVLFVVARAVRTTGDDADPHLFDEGQPRWLLLLPALAVLNGLTPYLEVKSGYGWNMYSNLSVVDGESNHFLVRGGPALTDGQSRLVQVVESDDPSLGFYIRGDWLLPEQQLVDHLADRPGSSAVGIVNGATVRYESDEGSARSAWRQKFQVFRAVDADGPVDCQPSFGPAR
ncbi:MAG: hypothetical protein OSA99_13955 [Acidimicrobiales bacterium]|nr:hypothetical protein [Acidimicrobiales bacterium]